MTSRRHNEKDYEYTSKPRIKKLDSSFKSKITFRERSEYGLFDEEIKDEFDDLFLNS